MHSFKYFAEAIFVNLRNPVSYMQVLVHAILKEKKSQRIIFVVPDQSTKSAKIMHLKNQVGAIQYLGIIIVVYNESLQFIVPSRVHNEREYAIPHYPV